MRTTLLKSVSLAHAEHLVYSQICLEEHNPICQELLYITDKDAFLC